MGLLELPPLPELVLEIIKAFLTKRDREFEDFLLSEKEVHQFLLEVANTPPFKRGEAPITNLRTALIVLGDTTTKILVLGLISQKLMRTSFTEFSFHKFWARALSQAIATYLFSDLIENIPPHLPLSAYLMDYGILLLYLTNPEKYLQVLSLKKQGYTLIEAEKEVFGISHPEVGAEYLENYALPRRFILNILHHHNLMEKVKGLPKEIQIDLSFLQIVDNFVGSFFSTNREERWNNFKKLVINYLKEEEIETLGEVFPKIANTYLPFFNLQEFQLKSFSELEREKEEEIKKLVSVEKEKEIIFPIE
ncbi:MAG: HDOD domain-containing protein, partial [Thermodesulfobacteriaceae bacterium]|nr:HDOD domain-containing protein [Thermodesulfobacteriaceae bacterium]